MAGTRQRGSMLRRTHKPNARILTARAQRIDLHDSITASAFAVNLNDEQSGIKNRAIRQGWQSQGWDYRDSVGELRYAVEYLANGASRMRLFPAAYPAAGETDNPQPLADMDGVPPELVELATDAIAELGQGRLDLSRHMANLSSNLTVAGEGWLLGQPDNENPGGGMMWTIRSVDEIVPMDGEWKLREIPSGPQGIIPWVPINPQTDYLARIWRPHPRFKLFADSPVRAMLGELESLLILRRMIRATGRSRLAGRGILAIPDELTIAAPQLDQFQDVEGDPFLEQFTDAITTPIGDEGVAGSVVPVVLRGPAEYLKAIQHIDFASNFDEMSSKVREELVGVIASTIDLPKEVVTGMADINHWSAWAVSADTFRNHFEPHVILCVDSLTGAYIRPYLKEHASPELLASGWIERTVLWYDPVELVTNPDQTSDAKDLYDRHAISAATLARVAGFSEEDMPSALEDLLRIFQNTREPPPNLLMAIVHQLAPDLTVPAITVTGTIPGVKESGVDVGTPPVAALPASPASPAGPTPVHTEPTPAPAAPAPSPQGPPAVTAAGPGVTLKARESRQLLDIDKDLRARLQTAANQAMLRQLERAGAKLVSKVAKDETMKTAIAMRPKELIAATLGPDVVTAAGFSAQDLLGGDWSGLKTQFLAWVKDAQASALKVAQRMTGLSPDHSSLTLAEQAQQTARQDAWQQLQTGLEALAQQRLYDPDPNTDPKQLNELNADTLVPASLIRSSLAVAGGATAAQLTKMGASAPVGQIGTGPTVAAVIEAGGGQTQGYEWVHASTAKDPFEPHAALDGTQFTAFDDDALLNPEDWPPVQYLCPGDHDGCLCDAMPIWATTDSPDLVRPNGPISQ